MRNDFNDRKGSEFFKIIKWNSIFRTLTTDSSVAACRSSDAEPDSRVPNFRLGSIAWPGAALRVVRAFKSRLLPQLKDELEFPFWELDIQVLLRTLSPSQTESSDCPAARPELLSGQTVVRGPAQATFQVQLASHGRYELDSESRAGSQ